MKILHIIASANPEDGGPIEGVSRLKEQMNLHGVEVELLTLDPPDAPWVQQFNGIVHAKGRPFPKGRGLVARFVRWARFSPDAARWAQANVGRYDAVVINGLWNFSTRVARLSVCKSQVPYVVYPHGMLDPWFRKRYPLKHFAKQCLWLINEGPLLRHARMVLFTCEEERILAARTFVPYRVNERVVAYGASEPLPFEPGQETAFRNTLPALGRRPYLLFLSRIHEKKGCDLLIEAFARIAGTVPDLDLVIAGPDKSGLRPGLEQLASKCGIADRIHWPGMLTGPVKYGALHGAEAFVLPSHQENFGIAVAEALACRCPVLISDQVNIYREIEAAGAGYCAPDTVEGTVKTLERWLATSHDQRADMRSKAEALYHERFTVEAAARDLRDILTEISNIEK